jgi:hypothetical protein
MCGILVLARRSNAYLVVRCSQHHLEVEVEVFISHVRTKASRKSHTGFVVDDFMPFTSAEVLRTLVPAP